MTTLRNLPALRRLAEEQAREQLSAERAFVRREVGCAYFVSKEDEWVRVEATLEILCDLTRPASRDAVARLVAAKLGLDIANGVLFYRADTYGTWRFAVGGLGKDGHGREFKSRDATIDPAITNPTEALTLIALQVLPDPA